jgi:leucine dehydrogenase
MNREHPEVEFVDPDGIYNLDIDVFSPCALGAVLNDETIPKLKAKVIAGTANNQLLDEVKHGEAVKSRGILYAPDFVINAGGVINVHHEIRGYNRDNVIRDVKKIYDRLLEIFKISDKEGIATQQAAKVFAMKRIETIGRIRSNFIP